MVNENQTINVGIGFATGRKSFQRVLKTYAYNFMESGLTEQKDVHLNVFVAYDLKYNNTQRSDYTNISQRVATLIDNVYFIGNNTIQKDICKLVSDGVIDKKSMLALFNAIKHGMF